MFETAIRANVLYQMGIADTTTVHTSMIHVPDTQWMKGLTVVTIIDDSNRDSRVTHVVRFVNPTRLALPLITHHA